MHPSLIFGLLATTLLPVTSAAAEDDRSPGITANFTSPSPETKSVDFYDSSIITWVLPSDSSAPENAYSILSLYIARSGPSTNSYFTPITDLDAAVDSSYTWNSSRAAWEAMVEGYAARNPGQDLPRDNWWFEARLYTPETRNITAGPYFRSSVFRAAYNETGTEGDDENSAAGVRASIGGALVALAAAVWVL